VIKAVIFDYGGVVTDGGGGNDVAERLAKNLNITIEEANNLLYKPWDDFFNGRINTSEYWSDVEKGYGHSIPIEKRDIFNTWDHMSPRPQIVQLVNKLKVNGCLVGLLSNVVPVTESIIRERGVYELFKPCILSCVFGYSKPDKEVYLELLRQLPGIKPEEVVFVDDQERCLEPARAMGIKTILAKNAQQIVNDVSKLAEIST
jgi:2-haloacid dehalogenase